MAGQIISTYEAKFGFSLDQATIKKVYAQIDAIKDRIDKKLAGAIQINKVVLNQNSLNAAKNRINKTLSAPLTLSNVKLNDAALKSLRNTLRQGLRDAAKDVTIPINRFQVNAVELRKQVQNAFTNGVTLKVNAVRTTGTSSVGGTTARRGFMSIGQSSLGYGLLGGMMGAVPAIAAGAGILSLNRISEELQAGRMSLNTITKGRGNEAFEWLRATGNEMGMDYRSQLPVFGNYLASSISKQGYDNSLQSFKDISLFGLTHGATNESMKGAMRALGQMWSKGKIMAEELNSQLSEHTGFGGARELFAEAYQIKTGGGLLGQKAEAALIQAMKEGKVLSADILPIVTRLMRERAGEGLSRYQQTTQFQRNQLSNAFSTSVETFGRGGFDAGMVKVFKTLTDFLNNHQQDIKNLGADFLRIARVFEAIGDTSTKVIDFFNDLSGGLTTTALTAGILYKIIGTKGSIFGALILAFDDLSGYIEGKNSLLGQFISYMNDMTGLDWNGLAAGIGVVGVAMLAAFSPITALAASIGALVAAYRYLKKLKSEEKPINPNSSKLPTYRQLSAENLRLADKNWEESPGFGTGWSMVMANASAPLDAILGFGTGSSMSVFRDRAHKSQDPAIRTIMDKLNSAAKAGWLQPDEYGRAKAALGSGFSSPEGIESWLNARQGAGNKPFWQQQQPVFNFYGDLDMKNVTDPQSFINELTKLTTSTIANHQTGEGIRSKP